MPIDMPIALRGQAVGWLLTWLSVMSCGDAASGASLSPLTQAQHLMDQQRNADAIALLETAVDTQPEDVGLRVALASAYMGAAGIDIYRLFDHFADIVFTQSLSQVFWQPASTHAAPPVPQPDATLAMQWLALMDEMLGQLRRVIVLLQRFPRVSVDHVPFVVAAMRTLQDDVATEVVAYRLLMRLIIMKTALEEQVIQNANFGTRAWLCGLDLFTLIGQAQRGLKMIQLILQDYATAFASTPDEIRRLQDALIVQHETLSRALRQPGVGISSGVLQMQLRQALACAG